MASFWSMLLLLILTMTHNFVAPTSSSSLHRGFKVSTISSAPAELPGPPLYHGDDQSPALSPDIAPLFPTPAKEPISPAGSGSLPTIPSNPSPPNPDALISHGPGIMAFPPSSSGSSKSSCSRNGIELLSGVTFMSLAMWYYLAS